MRCALDWWNSESRIRRRSPEPDIHTARELANLFVRPSLLRTPTPLLLRYSKLCWILALVGFKLVILRIDESCSLGLLSPFVSSRRSIKGGQKPRLLPILLQRRTTVSPFDNQPVWLLIPASHSHITTMSEQLHDSIITHSNFMLYRPILPSIHPNQIFRPRERSCSSLVVGEG